MTHKEEKTQAWGINKLDVCDERYIDLMGRGRIKPEEFGIRFMVSWRVGFTSDTTDSYVERSGGWTGDILEDCVSHALSQINEVVEDLSDGGGFSDSLIEKAMKNLRVIDCEEDEEVKLTGYFLIGDDFIWEENFY